METALHNEQPAGRRLVAGWLLLALTALALSTLCALLLVAARTPMLAALGAPGELFGRALALHVTLAVVVWFLSCAAGFWTMAGGGNPGTWRWTSMSLSGAGLAAMVIPLFLGGARPVLANYVPVLDHPVFLAGLVLFIAGVVLSGAVTASDIARRLRQDGQPWRLGALLSMFAAAMALAALIASITLAGLPSTPNGFEVVAWAPGHVLQFVHVLLLMSVWTILGEGVLGEAVAPRRWIAALLLLAAAPVLAAPFIYAAYPVDGIAFRRACTLLMAWGSWPAAALLAVRLLVKMARAGRAALAAPQAPGLLLSIVLFLLGCLLGALIRGDSTMVPAHYHGTVGAVTLSYMALGYRLLPVFGHARVDGKAQRRQLLLYGGGLVMLALALAWSGWIGVPRKTPHAELAIAYPAYFAAMTLVGLGGLLAVGGACWFVVNLLRSLYRTRTAAAPGPVRKARRDVRPAAMALTALLTLATGLLFAYWPYEIGTATAPQASLKDPGGHVREKRKEIIAREFAEGVRLLAAKDYQAAASALHRVLELAPEMPEAHVNMGFAMIGMEKHAMARDFFEVAINLRTAQINAYYGLAVALEGVGDIEGALGAMRTYIHRTRPDDPFLVKANSAVWEWEAQLAQARSGSLPPTAAIPENGKSGLRYPIPEKKFN